MENGSRESKVDRRMEKMMRTGTTFTSTRPGGQLKVETVGDSPLHAGVKKVELFQ